MGQEHIVLLASFTDSELRAELARRVARKKNGTKMVRCRDCKHCANGHTSQRGVKYDMRTTVCTARPKRRVDDKMCYYATIVNRTACEMFESASPAII